MRIRTDYLDLLKKIAWSFHYTTGIEWSELYSEACYNYCLLMRNYDHTKGKISAYVYTAVSNSLRNYILKEGRNVPTVSMEFSYEPEADTIMDDMNLLLEALNDDGKFIFEAILISPKSFIKEALKLDREMISTFCGSRGWGENRINNGVRNINQILKFSEISCIIS